MPELMPKLKIIETSTTSMRDSTMQAIMLCKRNKLLKPLLLQKFQI